MDPELTRPERGDGRDETRSGDEAMRVTLLALIVGALVAGCSDNATSLSARIGEAASRLNSGEAPSSLTVSFDPINGATSPYTVIFFPDRDVAEAELVAAGVDEAIARRIYSGLAYLGSLAGALVVEQAGERLQFTTSWKQFARVRPPRDPGRVDDRHSHGEGGELCHDRHRPASARLHRGPGWCVGLSRLAHFGIPAVPVLVYSMEIGSRPPVAPRRKQRDVRHLAGLGMDGQPEPIFEQRLHHEPHLSIGTSPASPAAFASISNGSSRIHSGPPTIWKSLTP
jgi:hypothetical protein